MSDRSSLARLRASPVLHVGPLRFHMATPLPALAAQMRALYADYPWHGPEALADFHVIVRPPVWWRRWLRPSVIGDTDLSAPFVPLPASHALVAAEMSLNWTTALTQLRYLTLHASGVALGDASVIMSGESGSGKSTLAAGLGYRGWRFFSDEFTLLDPATGLHLPYPRPTSLKNDAIPVMQSWIAADRFSMPFPKTQKGTICYLRPPRDAIAQMDVPARPRLIIFPLFGRDAKPELIRLPPSEVMVRLVAGSANYDGMGAAGFECLTTLVNDCPAYWLRYSSFDEADAMIRQALKTTGHG
jgi:HprK-related kinase A